MSLLIKNLTGHPYVFAGCSLKVNSRLQQTIKRCFSLYSSFAKINDFIGPCCSQPVLEGEPGYKSFARSLELSGKENRDTYLSHAHIQNLKNIQRENLSDFRNLIEELKKSNAEMRQLNKNIKDLVQIISLKSN